MIDIPRNLIVRRELWFDEPWQRDGADLLVFYHWSQPVNPRASVEVCSLEVDLLRKPEELWKCVNSTTRNSVNRAKAEGLSHQVWANPPRDVLDEFFEFKRRFDAGRGMESADPVWMYAYAEQGALILSRACTSDGMPLVWHSYARTPGWVRLLHSASLLAEADRNHRELISRANRYLHWRDMLECRELGSRRMDFGGWYNGTADEKLLRINAFKEQFGGAKNLRYHSMLPASTWGYLFLKAREYLKGESGLVNFV